MPESSADPGASVAATDHDDNLLFDHSGHTTAEDLLTVVERYTAVFGGHVLKSEPTTSRPASYFGSRQPEEVRLRGALISSRGFNEEIHQFSPFVPLHSHVGYRVMDGDVSGQMARMARLGVEWFGETPHLIARGPYEGRLWIYGQLGTRIVEIFGDPE